MSDAMLVPVSMKRMMSVMVMALVLFVSCQDATPTPLPTPVSYKSLYQTYQREREANPTRLEQTIEGRPLHVFEGPITNIQGSKVQFHIQRVTLGKDKYVECVFPEERDVLTLNIGETILVAGRLDRADDVVRLRDCFLNP